MTSNGGQPGSHHSSGGAEDQLLNDGQRSFVLAAIALTNDFAEKHDVELTVLREDAQGRFKNPGLLRSLTMLLLLPSVVPLFGQTHYRLAGGGFEFAGMIASFVCALILTVIVLRSWGHPFDKHSFITFYWTAISCGGGALFAWWNGIPHPLLTQFSIAGAIVVCLVLVLQVVRWRNLTVGRMRDEDAMDRSTRLRKELAAELQNLADRQVPASEVDTVQRFFTELLDRTIPKPLNRTFGQASTENADRS